MSSVSEDDEADVDEVSDAGNAHACCNFTGNASATPRDEPEYFKSEGMPTRADTEPIEEQEQFLDYWRKCSGAHTVEEWCENYLKHPAGWGALLMIHGIPEVTNRLRTKVDNCAIYSALFLSASLSVLFQAPGALWHCSEEDWLCQLQEQIFMLLLSCSVVTHMLSIFLSLAFTNALNEAARDSDVIRLFSAGRGFLATQRCQNSFICGVLLSLVCLFQVVGRRAGWKVLCLLILVSVGAFYVYHSTSKQLFQSSSITAYWRPDTSGLGTKPDDPYDISVPVAILKERAKAGHDLLTGGPTTEMPSDIDRMGYSPLPRTDARPMKRVNSHVHSHLHHDRRAHQVPIMAAFH